MSYRVEFSSKARKQLKKMDSFAARAIVTWIEKNLEGCENPRLYGKGLTSNLSGFWRYRVMDYRLICEIQEHTVIIYILRIERRDKVYRT